MILILYIHKRWQGDQTDNPQAEDAFLQLPFGLTGKVKLNLLKIRCFLFYQDKKSQCLHHWL